MFSVEFWFNIFLTIGTGFTTINFMRHASGQGMAEAATFFLGY